MTKREWTEEERRTAIEHRKVLEDIRVMLKMNVGQTFIKYLFKAYAVGELPEKGLDEQLLFEMLGLHRAGNAVWKIVCEADFEVAARLLAQVEKERYDELVVLSQTEPG